jgi:hypothetical protein
MISIQRAGWLCGVALAAVLAAGDAGAADLALRRVLLSTGGVGLYEYEADIEGDATVELKVRLDQVDDVLKSLVVFDDHGGVGGLDLAGAEPLAESFRGLPFSESDLQSAPQLLSALQGAEVEVGGPRAIAGRIVAVTEETETKPEGGALATRHRVAVMTDKGLAQFVLEQAESVQFADPAVRDAIAKALKAVASSHERDSRVLRLISRGSDKRKLRVAYLAAAPVWKTSYRLVLDPAADAKTAALQGWATLENLSGQDWKGVDLTLVSGRPVAYKQALYRAYMIDRPEAPLDVGQSLTPDVDRGALDMQGGRRALKMGAARGGLADMPASDALAAAPMAAPEHFMRAFGKSLSPAAAEIAAQDSETQVAFHLPFPVSVEAGRTLSLPIVDKREPVQRVSIYEPQVDRRHPLSAAELVNDGKSGLPPGVVTIYEGGADGVAYVGDSQLSATPAGEKRLLSFALDPKTTIEESDADNSSLARATLAKGLLTLEDLTRRRAVYNVKADEPRRLVVFALKLEGGKLTEPGMAGVTEAEGRLRIPFEVKVGDGQHFAVTQESTQTRAVALANLDDASLTVYARSGKIDAATRASLAKLGELRATQADAERAISQTQAQIDAVVADQTRLKDLLGAVLAGSDLQKRYLKKLDSDETDLEGLRAELTQRDKALSQARKAVEDFVAGL